MAAPRQSEKRELSQFDPARLMRFVLEMRQAGVTDARVLSALERTPRTSFAPTHLEGLAMDDIGLPLAHAQTMTKPSLVGRMLTALEAQAGDRVLEVGTGSGYQAAVLALLAHKVTTLERYRDLAAEARGRIGAARLMRAFAYCADGFDGWPEDAPFDRIIVNAGVAELPAPLLAQLKPGGALVAAVADRLIRVRNGVAEDLGPVKLQPLERGIAEGADSGG